ncbi:hypothetical protein BC834DRAFT_1002829 [Gloeopeniophorella convolvens]|nr:hypothetical protein BC834DRAFT_1002829 [Gloeopeniophorella convolvens]
MDSGQFAAHPSRYRWNASVENVGDRASIDLLFRSHLAPSGYKGRKLIFNEERDCFVAATDGSTTLETDIVSSKDGSVVWNQWIGDFSLHTFSRLTLRLFTGGKSSQDGSLASLELPSESLSQTSSQDFDLVPSDHSSGELKQHATLRIAIEALALPIGATSTPFVSYPMQVDNPADNIPPRLPPTMNTLEPDAITEAQHYIDQADTAVGNTKCAPTLIRMAPGLMGQAQGAFDQATDLYTTWKGVADKMKWVVDITEQIAEIHPYAKMAWSILSFIPKAVSNQIERDRRIMDLLQAIHDAFDIAEVASALQNVKSNSTQLEVLGAMLKHVCDCGDFIQSYARDKGFCTSCMWLNCQFVG